MKTSDILIQLGLKRIEALMLEFLIDHPGPIRQKDIILSGILYQPYISAAAKGLKTRGLIEETPSDRRLGHYGQGKVYNAKPIEDIRNKLRQQIEADYAEKMAALSSFSS